MRPDATVDRPAPWRRRKGVVRALFKTVRHALIGSAESLPDALLSRHPVLARARWRRGGLPPRVGGWALGQSTVLGIALGRTVFLAPHTQLDVALLLHELAHVHQFERIRNFPLRYLWESLRHGYHANRFEREADAWAAHILASDPPHPAKFTAPASHNDHSARLQDLPSRGV